MTIVKKKTGTAAVTVEHVKGGEVVHQSGTVSPEGVVVTSLPTANIGYSAQLTKNLGDYESLRVSVSLNLPVPMSEQNLLNFPVAELNEAFKHVGDWVDAKMKAVMEEAEEILKA